MAQKWNLQDIKPVERRKRLNPERQGGVVRKPPTEAAEREDIPQIRIEDGNKKKRSKLTLAIVSFVAIVGGGIVLSALMSGAELTVYPHLREPNVNATITAYPDPRAGELSYEVMTLEATGERQVTATGEETVEEQARGQIEIIKTSPGAERLIKNTRFESPSGQIYKIEESIVVPGAVRGEDGASVPGTITANVFAETTGEAYNLPAGTEFTIPGFAEGGFTELFESITAVNRQPIQGGFSGPRFIIDEGELATARQALQMELRDALLARVPSERPAGFTTFDAAVAFTYEQLPAVEYEGELVTIREQATLQVPLFRDEDFASYLAEATVPTYDDEPVRIDDTSTLSFEYVNATTSSSNIANATALEFTLRGTPLIVWVFDEEKLKADLLGVQKTALSNILSSYPAIRSANAIVRPFWKRSFPDDVAEIEITQVLERPE